MHLQTVLMVWGQIYVTRSPRGDDSYQPKNIRRETDHLVPGHR